MLLTHRRMVGLGLTFVLFVACVVMTSTSPTSAEDTKPKKKHHVILTRALKGLKDSRSDLKSLDGEYGGHRAKALKHIDQGIDEVEKAIKASK